MNGFDRHDRQVAGVAIGAGFSLLTLVVSAAMSAGRDRIGSANAVLVLVLLVVAGSALGGPITTLIMAPVTSLAFNFFFTAPYRTLRIADTRDVETTVLVFVIGLVVGELTVLRERIRVDSDQTRSLLASLVRVTAANARHDPVPVVWNEAERGLVQGLGLLSCRYEPAGETLEARPRIAFDELVPARGIRRFVGRGFVLPPEGAEIAVAVGHRRFGRIVLEPALQRGVSIEARRVGVAIAGQVAIALALTGMPQA